MTRPNLFNDQRQNVLTEELVGYFYDGLTSISKISHPKFSKEDLGRMLALVYELNSLSADAKGFQNTGFSDWNIPTMFSDLLFPMITLTGVSNELSLVLWKNETKYVAYDEVEVMQFTRKFYSTFRMTAEFTNLQGKFGVRSTLSSIVTNLVLNEDNVSDLFVKGSFPIIAIFNTFQDYAEGMKVGLALQLYFSELFDGIK